MNDIRISIPDGCVVEKVEVSEGAAVVTIGGQSPDGGSVLGASMVIKGATLSSWRSLVAEKITSIEAEAIARKRRGEGQSNAQCVCEHNMKCYLSAFLELIDLAIKKGGRR